MVPSIALVDRTCLGVKNAFVAKPIAEVELPAMLAQMGSTHPGGMVPCDWLVAQSVVLHAVDYARSLGFAPHRDFPEPLFGPRPEALLDTPLAHPARPFYVSGPDDAVARVIAQLDAAVGPGNYDVGVSARDEEDGDAEAPSTYSSASMRTVRGVIRTSSAPRLIVEHACRRARRPRARRRRPRGRAPPRRPRRG